MIQLAQNQLDHLRENAYLVAEHQGEDPGKFDLDGWVDDAEEDNPGEGYIYICADLGLEPRRAVTSRGFDMYLDTRDIYGSRVRVQKSSLATDDAVWIFASDNPQIPEPAPHLNVELARRVRDALDEFIREHE